jgi:transposase-like protein
MSGKRRKYTPEFREQAARLVIETGRPVAHVAAEIGDGEQVLGRWVRLQRRAAEADDTALSPRANVSSLASTTRSWRTVRHAWAHFRGDHLKIPLGIVCTPTTDAQQRPHYDR